LPTLPCSNADFQTALSTKLTVQSMSDAILRFGQLLTRISSAQWFDQLGYPLGGRDQKSVALRAIPAARFSDFDNRRAYRAFHRASITTSWQTECLYET
jgi:hypothetical protein